MIYESLSPEETMEIAYEIGKKAKSKDIYCLSGDLGVGKTVFVKGFTKALEVEGYISSPTFTILNIYNGKHEIYHFDMYRIEEVDELYNIGFDEYLFGDGISIIEWPEKIEEALPKEAVWIKIEKDMAKGEDYRKIEII